MKKKFKIFLWVLAYSRISCKFVLYLKIKDMKNAAQKFTYTGHHYTTFTVEAYGRKMYIEQVDGKFEVSSDGGSFGFFGSFGKAVSYAEKQLVAMHKNND